MIAVVQRVCTASVEVGRNVTARIGPGALVFLGVFRSDTRENAERLAEKISSLRYFDDPTGRLNTSIGSIGGSFLVVSQFTLCADCRKGTRPSYAQAAPGDTAKPLYEAFVAALRARGHPVQTGQFGAHMCVTLENDGPVTLTVQA